MSTLTAVALVPLALLAVILIPLAASSALGRGADLRLALAGLALYPGTVAWLARHTARSGLVVLTAVLSPLLVMMVVIGGIGGLLAGALGAFGVGIASTMAVAASRPGGRVGTSFGYVAGAIGIAAFLGFPMLVLLPYGW
ncbi:MAG: hypothetical protein WEC14_06955 [Chloroflexota bacterium]